MCFRPFSRGKCGCSVAVVLYVGRLFSILERSGLLGHVRRTTALSRLSEDRKVVEMVIRKVTKGRSFCSRHNSHDVASRPRFNRNAVCGPMGCPNDARVRLDPHVGGRVISSVVCAAVSSETRPGFFPCNSLRENIGYRTRSRAYWTRRYAKLLPLFTAHSSLSRFVPLIHCCF